MRTVRPICPALPAAVLLAFAACLPLPAQAQTTASPAAAPAPTTAFPAVMPAPTPAAVPVSAPVPLSVSDALLPIPMPAGATVQVEMDVHDDDLLGVYKSFLRGIGQAAQTMPLYPEAAHTSVSNAQMSAIINSTDLSDVLKGTTHVHLLVMQVPGASPFAAPMPVKTLKHKAAVRVPAALSDQTAFYETAFGAEGGHRILYTNVDPLHLTMVSFGHTRGYAVMVQVPGTIAVMRADGYPDLSKLSALVTQVSAAAAKAVLDSASSHKKTNSGD